VRSRRRSQIFREEEAAGALDNGAQDSRSPPENKGMLTTDVGDKVDVQGDPAAAERKRRRAALPGNSSSAAEIGRDAGRAAHKKSATIPCHAMLGHAIMLFVINHVVPSHSVPSRKATKT
jgi:hypothetical protein